jgi:RimJ/RimL family protein N-acetyltransferase
MIPPILRDFPDAFETERLLIRSPLPGDGAELNAAVIESLDNLRPWMSWAKEAPTMEESEENVRQARTAFLARTDLRLHLYLKGTNTLVGSSGLHCPDWSVPRFDIGYWCRTRFQGQGYITEAVRGILCFAFETLGAQRIGLQCDAENERSRKVAERIGFHLEGEHRNDFVGPNGDLRNILVFSLIPDEYRSLRASTAATC